MITVLSAHSPAFTADGSITLTVLFSHIAGEVPFTASQSDGEGHGVDLYTRAESGEFGAVVPYVAQPTPIPGAVTRRQFKLALLDIDLLDDVESIVSASADRALKINWGEAQDFERTNPFVAQMAAAIGKTPAEVDALFILAKTL